MYDFTDFRFTEIGKDLLKRVLMAGARQGNPIAEWRTNISKLLSGRSKRYIGNGKTIATKAKTIYKGNGSKQLTNV